MKKYRYDFYVTKFVIFSCIVFIAGLLFTVMGLIDQYHRHKIKDFYGAGRLYAGCYVQCDITLDRMMGRNTFYALSGEEQYMPLCVENAVTSERRYLMADGENGHYMSLVVPNELRIPMQELIDNEEDTYHVYGRIGRLKQELPYDGIGDCTGIKNKNAVNRMVSTKYEIRVLDPEDEGSMWYKGLIFFLLGLWGILQGVEKREV